MDGLPQDYVEQYVYQYAGYVKNRSDGRLNGGCPICMEGESWGRKRRFWYDPRKEGNGNTVKCWNCGHNSNSAGFIMEVAGLTFREIMDEVKEYDIVPNELKKENKFNDIAAFTFEVPDLPDDAINLFDESQVNYYSDHEIVKKALSEIKKRRIDKAINRPDKLFLSLDDYTHKNRLIIPYYVDREPIWYQSRKLLDDDSEKYLSKSGSSRPIFNFDKIDPNFYYIFVFEGAIDSMFIKNGTCVSGITDDKDSEFIFTKLQKKQLARFPMHEIIFVLDSPYLDETADHKKDALLNMGYKVFNWPEKLGMKYKDMNELTVKGKIDAIKPDFIIDNVYENRAESVSDVIDTYF